MPEKFNSLEGEDWKKLVKSQGRKVSRHDFAFGCLVSSWEEGRKASNKRLNEKAKNFWGQQQHKAPKKSPRMMKVKKNIGREEPGSFWSLFSGSLDCRTEFRAKKYSRDPRKGKTKRRETNSKRHGESFFEQRRR